jgi:membrane protein
VFNVEDVAVDHYVDWDWRVVFVVIIAGLLLAGFSLWSSPERDHESVLLSVVLYGFPPLVAVACVWLGVSRLESWRWAGGAYLLLLIFLAGAFLRCYLGVGLWWFRTCILVVALGLALWAFLWEFLRRTASMIPMTVSGLVTAIIMVVVLVSLVGSRR